MKKKRRRLKRKYVIFNIISLLIISCSTFIYSLYKIVLYKMDNNINEEIINNIQENTIIEEIPIEEENITTTTEEVIPDLYWDYINTSYINVDINELRKTNSDTVGWLKVNNTNINYPYVRSTNNSYYLTHSFDKTYNVAGWIFNDYRNNGTDDKNTIIYGHAMNNKTMFGSLKNVLNESWYNNEDNLIIKTSTLNGNYLWRVFSIYKIPKTSDYIKTNFVSDEEYISFLNTIKNRSIKDFNISLDASSRIITLSTCSDNSKNRIVLHAVLINQ